MNTQHPFCANPACVLHTLEASANWAQLDTGIVLGRTRDGARFFCDSCYRARQAMPEPSEPQRT